MELNSTAAIRAAGFTGFASIRELRTLCCDGVPDTAGVYLILRNSPHPPRFLATNPGGRYKGRDPTVLRCKLAMKWVKGTIVLYIGKAGGRNSRNVLSKRLSSYIRFGTGISTGHWGGRLIWQLCDADDLLVCWRSCAGAAELEKALIGEFSEAYGKLPFANLRS